MVRTGKQATPWFVVVYATPGTWSGTIAMYQQQAEVRLGEIRLSYEQKHAVRVRAHTRDVDRQAVSMHVDVTESPGRHNMATRHRLQLAQPRYCSHTAPAGVRSAEYVQ